MYQISNVIMKMEKLLPHYKDYNLSKTNSSFNYLSSLHYLQLIFVNHRLYCFLPYFYERLPMFSGCMIEIILL